MITLKFPDGNVVESIRACAASITDKDLAHRLVSAEIHFAAAEKNYQNLASHASLFSIVTSDNIAKTISVAEMRGVYKDTFSKLGSSCRYLYDRIKVRAKICPICNARNVGTLDHYLAQSKHPIFILTPLNLVPACGDCNKKKLAFNPEKIEEQTLHPYFDKLPVDVAWLSAKIVEDRPVGVVFYATPPSHWNSVLSARLINHFNEFGLNEIYSAKAASEIAQVAAMAEMEYITFGSEGLKNHLELQASLRRLAAPHSWMHALYQGLANSTWFINGGFREVKAT